MVSARATKSRPNGREDGKERFLTVFLRILGISADVLTVVSFCLTVFLLIKSEALRKEIASQKAEYIKAQGEARRALRAIRDNIVDGKPITLKVVSSIRELIYSYDQQYGRLWSLADKAHVRRILRILAAEDVSAIKSAKLSRQLDYFIGRFYRKEQT